MNAHRAEDVTELLRAWSDGDQRALDGLDADRVRGAPPPGAPLHETRAPGSQPAGDGPGQ